MLTVYNYYKNRDTGKEEYRRTLLSGTRASGQPAVYWEDARAVKSDSHGLSASDGILVMIWFSADAEGKTYLPPKQFAALPPTEVEKHWTLTPGKDRLIRGVATEDISAVSLSDVLARYDCCATVKSVDTCDQGRAAMWHWEVGCA